LIQILSRICPLCSYRETQYLTRTHMRNMS